MLLKRDPLKYVVIISQFGKTQNEFWTMWENSNFFLRLKNPAWRETLDKELVLCSSKTIPLCNPSRELQTLTKETKRHNLSQLSQLSFEELEGKFAYFVK